MKANFSNRPVSMLAFAVSSVSVHRRSNPCRIISTFLAGIK